MAGVGSGGGVHDRKCCDLVLLDLHQYGYDGHSTKRVPGLQYGNAGYVSTSTRSERDRPKQTTEIHGLNHANRRAKRETANTQAQYTQRRNDVYQETRQRFATATPHMTITRSRQSPASHTACHIGTRDTGPSVAELIAELS